MPSRGVKEIRFPPDYQNRSNNPLEEKNVDCKKAMFRMMMSFWSSRLYYEVAILMFSAHIDNVFIIIYIYIHVYAMFFVSFAMFYSLVPLLVFLRKRGPVGFQCSTHPAWRKSHEVSTWFAGEVAGHQCRWFGHGCSARFGAFWKLRIGALPRWCLKKHDQVLSSEGEVKPGIFGGSILFCFWEFRHIFRCQLLVSG